jgi:hypothetical protein
MHICVHEFVLFGLRMGDYLSVILFDVMNRKFKQWWSSIPPISTKRTNNLSPQLKIKKTTTYRCDVGNQSSALRQAQQCGGIKAVNGIPMLFSWQLDLQRHYTYKRTMKTCTDPLALKQTTYYHTNEWQDKGGQYNSRVNECSQWTDY